VKNGHIREAYLKRKASTFDLLGKTSLDQLIFQLKILLPFFITIYLDEEVNCIGYFPSVSVPWTY
jgi:hypothetical protein